MLSRAIVAAVDGIRSDALCVQARSDIRVVCDDSCGSDRFATFPGDHTARLDCPTACHGLCVDAEQECKPLCKCTVIPVAWADLWLAPRRFLGYSPGRFVV